MRAVKVEVFGAKAGDSNLLNGNILVTTDKTLSPQNLKLTFMGEEKVHIVAGEGDLKRTFQEKRLIIKKDLEVQDNLKEGNLPFTPGEHKLSFKFIIPPNLPPSYSGLSASIRYSIRTMIDEPDFVEGHDSKTVIVRKKNHDLKVLAYPVHFWSDNYYSSSDLNPGFYTELVQSGFMAGDDIYGFLTLKKKAYTKVRRIIVFLSGKEHAYAKGQKSIHTRYENVQELLPEKVKKGVPVQFLLHVPEDAPSSFRAMYSDFEWQVGVTLEISDEFSVTGGHPVEIFG